MSSEANIVGYCRSCGKALDESTVRTAHGTIYCEEHVPMTEPTEGATTQAGPGASPYASSYAGASGSASPYSASPYSSPYTAAPPPIPAHDVSPGLAFVLGFIPGVGAIYNGQYAKGLVHVVIVGLMISIISNGAANRFEPLMGLMLGGFWFYMAFEAYHTARRRQQGLVVDEFSSLFPMRGGSTKFPAAPIALIALGVVFLLNNLDFFEIERVIRYWPVLLIALGAYMLYIRMAESGGSGDSKEIR